MTARELMMLLMKCPTETPVMLGDHPKSKAGANIMSPVCAAAPYKIADTDKIYCDDDVSYTGKVFVLWP